MRKYKVNRDQTKSVPDKATIEKYKDFSKLSHEYENYVKRHRRPIYKDKKLFFILLLIVLLAYLLSGL